MRIALTIDTEFPDRPGHNDHVQQDVETILSALRECDAPATFFVQGRWAEAYPTLVRNISREHTIGNHAYNHNESQNLTRKGLIWEIKKTEEILTGLIVQPVRPYFRSPYGHGTALTTDVLERLGYQDIGWDWTLRDWESMDMQTYSERWRTSLVPGIALFHSWATCTVSGLRTCLGEARARGGEFVSLKEWLNSM